MLDWTIRQDGYEEQQFSSLGNRYLVGNGYLGIRGTLEEYEADRLPAINLAGIYDRASGWREPINLPNGCFSYLRVDSEVYKLPDREAESHRMELDYRHGIFKRCTVWHTSRGNVMLETERFASMDKVNLIGIRFRVTADFHADIELVTGVDCDVWDLNGPHLEQVSMKDSDGDILVTAVTHEDRIPIAVAETVRADYPVEIKQVVKENKILHRVFFITKPGETYVTDKWVSVYTGKDCTEPQEEALSLLKQAVKEGYSHNLKAHRERWEELWKHSEVVIEGDDKAMEAVNYSLYHLHSIAPRHTESLSIPARGLSGQTYKGAVFWDTEMFMLDFFLMSDPKTARVLMKYRIDTLDGALKKAAHYGYEGAFYAWESQEGGYDACTDYNVTDVFTGRPMRTYFKDKQVHISAAVAYGILRYVEWTGDDSLLDEKGVKTIVECAKFYYSLLLHGLTKDYYEIRDVIGPDEYHERVNNNGYTNRMAKLTMEKAVEVIRRAMEKGTLPKEYDGEKLIEQFADGAAKLFLPTPQKAGAHKDIIEQFDGYFDLEDVSLEEVRGRLLHEKEYWGGAYGVASHTQIIKQADVVTWLNLFSKEYDTEILRANWEYYEPRTEHGSSLSAGMYSMLACKIGEPNRAYPFFFKSATADLKGGGKEWAGLVYIGGTHPAAAGAAYMTAVEGFGGISLQDGKLVCNPSLPDGITGMRFHVYYQGQEYEVKIDGKNGTVKAL
mgnify:CR=1 FL=1